MDFDNLAHWLIVILWAVSLIGVYAFTRKRGEGDTLLSKLFTTNADLDTTLLVILKGFTVLGVFVIVFAMVMAFHDDIKDKAGMVIISAIGMISLAMRDMFPNGKNGK